MVAIGELATASELAQAAYSTLLMLGAIDPERLRIRQNGDANMSVAQSDDVASRYTIEGIFNDPATGAYAAIFKNKQTQELTVAIRGTDFSANLDWLSNAYLAAGIPPSLNPQFRALQPIVAQWIQSGVLPPGSTIAGHSLGGYLAAAIKASFPETFSRTYTFNAPGFVDWPGGLPGALQTIFGIPVPQSGVVDVRGSAGLSVISGLGNHLGSLSALEIESAGTLGFDNHSVERLTQSLAVLNLLGDLDPSLTLEEGNRLLASASGVTNQTHEALIGSLLRLLNGSTTTTIPIDDAQQLYSAILSLNGKGANGQYTNAAFAALAGKTGVKASSASLGAQARTEFSAFLSLLNLSPVVLSGTDAALQDRLRSVWGNTFTVWEADKNSSIAERAAGKVTYSDQWLADRAAMLDWLVVRNRTDITGELGLGTGQRPVHYQDVQTATSFQTGLNNPLSDKAQTSFGGDAADLLSGKSLADRLYGGAGADMVNGLGGADYLEGNAGADTLNGGAGNDTLVGGLDADVFIVDASSGVDTILNPDAADRLQLLGRTLTGSGTFKSSTHGVTVWVDSSLAAIPIAYIHDAAHRELTVAGAGSFVRVTDFDSGELGITVPLAPAPTPAPLPVASFDLSTVAGRNQWGLSSTLPQTDNWRVFNANGVTTGSVSTAQGNDVIVGGAASVTRQTLLSSGAGNDRVYSSAELTLADAIAAGEVQAATGRSVYMLAGNVGDDLLVGAGDDDALFGGSGNDTLVGGNGGDVIFADGNNDGAYGVDGGTGAGSWITGANNALTDQQRQLALATQLAAVGSTGSLQVFKGLVRYISPLADTDLSGLIAMQRQNVVPDASDMNIYTPGSQRTYADLTGGAWFATNVGNGNDLVYAGAGDDVVNAGAGDDVVDAGTGNDQVAGYDGNDVIYGGAGDDRLHGDYQAAVTTGGEVEYLSYYGASGVIRYTLDASRHGQDVIDGGAGDDVIFGGGGSDLLDGGAGDDVLYGDDDKLSSQYVGDDRLDGGDGNDQLVGGGGADELIGGDGADRLEGDDLVINVAATWHGADRLDGGRGDDTLLGGGGDDVLLGAEGNDWLAGEDQLTVSSGTTLTGNDTLDGGAGNDTLVGGAGDDVLDGGAGNDMLYGQSGADTLRGGVGANLLYGGEGDDLLISAGTNDTLDGGAGHDTIFVSDGATLTLAATSFTGVDADEIVFTGTQSSDRVTVTIDPSYNASSQRAVLRFSDTGTSVAFLTQGTNVVLGDSLGKLTFVDGVTWAQADLRQRLRGIATDGADVLRALYGLNDSLDGLGGNDAIYGASGNDTLLGGDGDDWLNGQEGNDLLVGGLGSDEMLGGEGADTYASGAGNDAMRDFSTTSNDVYRYVLGDGLDIIDDRGGNDRLEFGQGTGQGDVRVVRNGGGIVELHLAELDRIVLGVTTSTGALDLQRIVETLRFEDGSEWDVARIKQESLKSTAGADSIYGFETNDTIDGADGDDTIDGLHGDDALYGGSGNDLLWDPAGDDTMYGGAGDDYLLGGAGNDVLVGGTGNDYIQTDAGDNIIHFALGDGADTISLGGRTDRIEFGAGITAATLSMRQVAHSLVVSTGTSDSITMEGLFHGLTGAMNSTGLSIRFADQSMWTTADIEAEVLRQALLVTDGADERYLSPYSDNLNGGDGDDTLHGLGGNDTLLGGRGEDRLLGGIDNDNLQGGAGNDTLEGEDGDDTLLGGDGDDILRGGYGGSDTFDGGAGNDILEDLQGADVVYFGRGDGQDVVATVTYSAYGVDSAIEFKPGISPSDVVARRVWDGQYPGLAGLELSIVGTTDRIVANSFFNPGTYSVIQQVRFSDGTIWDATRIQQEVASSHLVRLVGTELADTLIGGSGSDALYGLGGNDSMTGNTGNDTLDGGEGNDTMVGGAGDDVYVVNTIADVIREAIGEGTDTVQSSITLTLGSNLENLTLTGTAAISGTGNARNNILTGNSANNTLNGGAGSDTLVGGTGNDTYVVDMATDVVTESAGEGTDTVRSSVTWALGEHFEKLTLTGTAAIHATGNDLANVLTGNSGNNILTGGTGDDTLNGGVGTDTLIGGVGNDTYVVDVASDVVIEAEGEGTDTVQSAVAWTLAADFENLTLIGSAAINGTGNALNNALTGNNANNVLIGGVGNDTLNGGASADTLVGGTGDDTYVVENRYDVITEAVSEGIDTVQARISWTLGANLENLTLTGSATLNGTGNALSNVLTGNSGANALKGGAGDDTYIGGLGADTLVDTSTTSNDIYVWGRGHGADTMTDSGGTDRLDLLAGVTEDQIWLRHVGNNLELSVIGTTDKLTINGWYSTPGNQVESFKLSDGQALLASQVQQLVDAMALFAPPAVGQTTLPPSYQSALNPVIAPSWA